MPYIGIGQATQSCGGRSSEANTHRLTSDLGRRVRFGFGSVLGACGPFGCDPWCSLDAEAYFVVDYVSCLRVEFDDGLHEGSD